MKILLAACNAKYIHSNLAVYNLRAYASEWKEHILLKEYTINQLKDDILRDIYKSGADIVCFSCYIWNIEYVKKINPDSISKTLNTIQKVLQITQSFGGKPTPNLYNANYNSWWD